MPRPIITFLSDYGTKDGYAGAVKGVILQINPNVNLVDLTHDIPPQDVVSAALLLGNVAPYFPVNTIHLAVVDPGVGSDRIPLLLHTPGATFIGPDNGVFSWVLGEETNKGRHTEIVDHHPIAPGIQAYKLTNTRFWNNPVSQTFHGRDIFGPVAAHLSTGIHREELGQPISSIKSLVFPKPYWSKSRLMGEVIHIDHFGNLITNVPGDKLGIGNPHIRIAGQTIHTIVTTYSHAKSLSGLIGSHNLLEIAIFNGSAWTSLNVNVGEPLSVTFDE